MSEEPQTPDVDDTPEQVRVRQGKRDALIKQGLDPYPVAVPRTHSLREVIDGYGHLETGEETTDVVSVAGRVMFMRNGGKLCFAAIQDGHGDRLQVMVSLAEVGQATLDSWKRHVDLGDIVSVTGRVISSKRGELSVLAQSYVFAAKSLRPLPVLHKDLNEETRVRQRYTDLLVRDQAREMARLRPAVVRSIRDCLHEHDFIEVETPMLQTQHGGASARPFVTQSNALAMELYLRIAPELFLKRAAVGGLERVFEINRNFRNEGADSTHSPEFAMLEFYQAWADYNDVATLTKELVQAAAVAAAGSTTVTLADGTEYDLGGEWESLEMYPSLSEAVGQRITPETSVESLQSLAQERDIEIDPTHVNHGKLIEELWEATAGAE